MGRMLAQLYMTAGSRILAVQFLSTANKHRVGVIDFNRAKKLNLIPDQIPLLVDGFFTIEA